MKKRWAVLFQVLGVLLVGVLVYQVGLREIWMHVRMLGWGFALVLGLSLLWQVNNVWVWHICFERSEDMPRFRELLRVRLAGDALGNLTPGAQVVREAARLALLRGRVRTGQAVPSVVISKTVEVLSGWLYVLAGTGLALHRALIPDYLKGVLFAVLALVSGVILAGAIAQRHNAFTRGLHGLRRFRLPGLERLRDQAEGVDRALNAFYRMRPGAFWILLGLHTVSWVLGTLELVLILWLMGSPLPFATAFLVHALMIVMNTVFCFVPSGAGVLEGGHAAVFGLMGLGSGLGLAVGIIRRVRKVFWTAVGLVLLRVVQEGK